MSGPHRALFPGWQVVGALFVVGFMLYGGGLWSFILFVPPLAKEFHWSTAGTGGLVSAFYLSAPLSLWAEPIIRRFGEKRLIIAGILIEAVSLMLLLLASTLWQMYLLRALAGLGKVVFAITLPIILSKWFSRRFGLAAAIMYSGWHVGGLGLASLTQYLLSNFGWRETSIALGLAQISIALPVALWGLRHSAASEIGLGLDGDALSQQDTHTHVEDGLDGSSVGYGNLLRDLIRLRPFQILIVATPVYYLTYGGVLLQQAAVVQGVGATAYAASLAVGVTAGCAALGSVLGGWVLDRSRLTSSAFMTFGLLLTGDACLLAATHEPSTGLLMAHAVLYGLGIGSGDIFWITLMKRRIPDRLFGSAWGIWYFQQLGFLILAPAGSGAIFDATKSYSWMLSVEMGLIAIPLILGLWLASTRFEACLGLSSPRRWSSNSCDRDGESLSCGR